MSEVNIVKYKLLTQPIITKNLIASDILPGILASKTENIIFDNAESDTIIISLQGAPVTEFIINETYHILVNQAKLDLKKAQFIHVHQEQTPRPWEFKESITFKQAKEYDKITVKYVADLIKFYKNKDKKVYIIGVSFGAFVAQDLIATYGNIADKYLIIAGGLDMPKEVWTQFSKGSYVGFEYDKNGNSKVIKFDAKQAGMGGSGFVEGQNMAKEMSK
ncbi:conserved hypothetical protein [Abyssogena phaseoliformis symbiont OG214]|uniref:hypothetical protein n=1 Tax=Abyssogena phaseoliformis symbiont TaxID=596095 RepID=UPI001914FA9E|nr:hypothetical protein [Abyssogena phaseoliformis symbiont]BBB22614.1 conserved hypothetical protein [Abyssogena phaseoliformis symbiont OG214]